MTFFARLLGAVLVIQFYLAGVAIFGAASFTAHALMGWGFILLSAVLTIVSIGSKRRRSLAPVAIAVLLLSIAQPVIALGLRRWPWAAALHPAVGLALVGLLVILSNRAAQPFQRDR